LALAVSGALLPTASTRPPPQLVGSHVFGHTAVRIPAVASRPAGAISGVGIRYRERNIFVPGHLTNEMATAGDLK
jgi:hypothetical protein